MYESHAFALSFAKHATSPLNEFSWISRGCKYQSMAHRGNIHAFIEAAYGNQDSAVVIEKTQGLSAVATHGGMIFTCINPARSEFDENLLQLVQVVTVHDPSLTPFIVLADNSKREGNF